MVVRRIDAPVGALLAAAALALVAGCGGGPAGDAGTRTATDEPAADAPAGGGEGAPAPSDGSPPGGAGAATPAADDGTSVVARSADEVAVFAAPGDGEPTVVLPATTEFGSPRALLVVADDGDWLEVALPERPNGSTGWIRADGVELRAIDESIVIDLAARTLTLYDGGDEVLATPVAVGTDDNPTPTGDFYVVDKLDTGDPTGPYGRFALGLSAHSDVLTEFAGGDGQVGIHGTDDPASIGRAVSHGCVRVPGEVAQVLNDTVNLGTPVAVT
jgi:hypothetical protein